MKSALLIGIGVAAGLGVAYVVVNYCATKIWPE